MTDNKTNFNMNTANGSIHINKPGKKFKKHLKKLKEALGPEATVTRRAGMGWNLLSSSR